MKDRLEYERGIINMLAKKYGKDGFFNKKVLELNCGEANISAALARLGADVTAVDSRADNLAKARQKHPHLQYRQVDLNHEFPFKELFDYVLCLDFPGYTNLLKKAFNVSLNLVIESENIISFDYPFKIDKIEFSKQNYDLNKVHRKIWFCTPKLEPAKNEEVILLPPPSPISLAYDDSQQVSIIPNIIPENRLISIPDNPKIALCLSGHLRTFDRTHSSMIVNLIDSLNCDVFIHTWDTIGSSSSKLGSDAHTAFEPTTNRLEAVCKYYSPKRIVVEKFDNQKFIEMGANIPIPEQDIKFISGHLGYHFAMFYGIQHCNDLRKNYESANGIKYDYIIRFRTDLNLKTRIDRKFLPTEKGVINVPTIGQYCPEGMNDQFAIGRAEDMNIYCDMFDSIKDYVVNRVTTIRPEALLQYHCTKNNLSIHRKNINYEIVRINNTGVAL